MSDRPQSAYYQLSAIQRPAAATAEPPLAGTMVCPICGVDSPHYHSPADIEAWATDCLSCGHAKDAHRRHHQQPTGPLQCIAGRVGGLCNCTRLASIGAPGVGERRAAAEAEREADARFDSAIGRLATDQLDAGDDEPGEGARTAASQGASGTEEGNES